MGIENYTIQDICNKLNLSKSHVQRLIREGQLKPSNPGQRPVRFSHEEFKRVSDEVRVQRLDSLKKMAEASEEIGLYDDVTPTTTDLKLGVAKGKFDVPEPDDALDETLAELFKGKQHK